MLNQLTALLRLAALFAIIGFYVVVAVLVTAILGGTALGKKFSVYWLHWNAKLGLKALGIAVEQSFALDSLTEVGDQPGSRLIVSNHLSYLDILVISSVQPTMFVTSIEIRDSGFLGFLCKAAGCHFVERRNRNQIDREIREIANSLSQGINVVVFPEATSTNGAQVLPFKVSLLDAAILSGRPLKPLCINYREIAGSPVSVLNRDEVCWYGDMTFFDHLSNVAKRGSILVELTHLSLVSVTAESDRKFLAAEAFRQIVGHYQPLV